MLPRLSGVVLIVAVLAAIGTGLLYFRHHAESQTRAPGKPEAERAQPVVVAKAVAKAMPREFDTVGRVQTMASIAVRSRIDGVIESVPVSEGQDVKTGDTLFVLDTRLLRAGQRQAEANLAKDTSQLDQAKRELARMTPLAQRDFASKSSLDQLQANVSSLEASVKSDEAQIESIKIQITYATIKAPIDGRIGSIASKAGSSIKANDTGALLTINQIRPIYASFSVPQRYLPSIQQGMAGGPLAVVVTAPDLEGLEERGTLAYTDNTVDPTTNTLGVWARLPNPNMRLWPGLYVNISLIFGTQENAVVVPMQAVQAGQQSSFVFLVRADMTVEMRAVKVDRVIGQEAVIAEGLTGDETVVTDGQLRLSDGTKVKITEPRKGQQPDKVAEGKREAAARARGTVELVR